ncbi:MAG: hypothetical protein ABGY41_14330 [Candidatus Poribacteria bacterium]
MLNLFARRRDVGELRLDFYSLDEVAVTDGIPAADGDVHYPLWFAFLYAGKLLVQMPGNVGLQYVNGWLDKLAPKIDRDDPIAYNESLLKPQLSIVENRGEGRWVYSGDLFYKGSDLIINTRIARGEEEYFHSAAIGAVMEWTRRGLGDSGGAVCLGFAAFLNALRREGNLRVTNLGNVIRTAGAISVEAAMHAGWEPQD